MTWRSYAIPLLISLMVHVGLVVVVMANWHQQSEARKAQRPQVVQAKVVEYTPKVKRQAEQQAAQQKIIDLRERRRERERREAEQRRQREAQQEKAQREQEQQAQAERERREAERRAQEAAQRRQEERRREEERQTEVERQQRLLDQALEEEAEFLEAQQSEQVAQSYVDVMAQRIENNWSRPPSARTGMQVVLALQLVPTGEVVSVTVVESSGSKSFDRSAEQAVKRVERFEELQKMSPQVFERHFRQLRLVFKPEDLRL